MRRLRLRNSAVCVGFAVVLGACSASSGPGAGSSTQRSLRLQIAPAPFELPAPVQREVAVFDGGRIYLAGGLDGTNRSVDGVFSMDPATGHLRQLGRVPHPFHDGAGAVIGHRLVIFGGGSAEGTNEVQSFDLRTHEGSVIGHLPGPVSDLAAATVGRIVYLIGGYDGARPLAAIYATTDGLHLSLVARLPVGLRYPSVAAVGDQIVIAGGTSSGGAVSTVYVLDTSRPHVSLLGHLQEPVTQAAALALDGRVYVIGGEDRAGAAVTSVSEVDPVSGSIREDRPIPRPVADAGVASGPTSGWVIGGLRGTALSQVLRVALISLPR